MLLAVAEASFLRGEEPLRSGGVDHRVKEGDDAIPISLAQRWRLSDQRAQLSLARSNPQVKKYTMPCDYHLRSFPPLITDLDKPSNQM